MTQLRNNRNKSVSHKLKRSIAFAGWRRNISGKEKQVAKELRTKDFQSLTKDELLD